MKIVVMGSSQGMGGLQTHFHLLQQFLRTENHDLLAVSVGDQERESHRYPGTIYAIRQTPGSFTGKIRKWLEFRRARRAAISFKPHLFVAAAAGKMYAAMAAAFPPNTPSFYQEVISDLETNDPIRLAMNKHFKAVAVQSPSMVATYRRAMGSSMPVRALPCFANSPAKGFRAVRWTHGEPVRLAYFGRLAANKGLVQFLESCQNLIGGENLQIDIHGSGPEKENIAREIDRAQLGDRVRLCGRYPDGEECARLMVSYHGLVLPSTHCEGLPLILLESMSYGLPFLSTTIGAIPDAAVGNADAVICSPERESMRRCAGEFVHRIKTGDFNSARLIGHFEENFSAICMQRQWREMLSDPELFFGLNLK
jgi:glycosyltransferase involved in cell wall biosynthesis